MAHFAQIENGKVIQVIVVEPTQIEAGEFGDPENWVQTSYNTRGGVHYDPQTRLPSEDQSKAMRKNFAGPGDTYDATRDAFIPAQVFPSWLLNETTCLFEAPTPRPSDDKDYVWNEATVSWLEVE